MKSTLQPFIGAYYASAYRESMKNLAVPMWSAAELWGNKESEKNFRNCLVGTAEDCAAVWQRWLSEKVFEKDTQSTFYVLKQVFRFRRKLHERWGVFGSISAVDKSVKIHEEVSLEGAENTRQRFDLSAADLTPVFAGVHAQEAQGLRALLQEAVEGQVPFLIYQEHKNAYHVLWRVESTQQRDAIAKFFDNKPLYLLDGHHRFRGAQDNHKMGKGDGRLLACVTSMAPEDLLILPIHRAVLQEKWLLPQLAMEKLQELGCTIVRREAWSKEKLDDLVFRTDWSEGDFYFLPVQSAELYLMRLPNRNGGLIVENVEREIFSKISDTTLLPVNDLHFLVDQLASGQAQAAVILPPIAADAVCKVADANKVLPRKSTQFYPKPALGLICRPWV